MGNMEQLQTNHFDRAPRTSCHLLKSGGHLRRPSSNVEVEVACKVSWAWNLEKADHEARVFLADDSHRLFKLG